MTSKNNFHLLWISPLLPLLFAYCIPEKFDPDIWDPSVRFVDNEDDTITDTQTNLIWLKQDSPNLNWQAAVDCCNNLTFAGSSDWRLPTIYELQAFYGLSGEPESSGENSIISNPIFNSQSDNYWSASTYAANTANAWRVDFNDGNVSNDAKTNAIYARCVR